MVGPSLSEDDRRTLTTRLKVAFVATVAASAGLTALAAGGGTTAVLGATVAGGLVGAALAWYLGVVAGQARRRAGRR